MFTVIIEFRVLNLVIRGIPSIPQTLSRKIFKGGEF